MAGKKQDYTIYGTSPGAASESHPQSAGLHEMEELKVEIEHILQGLDIKYPIQSRDEFLNIVSADIPGICDLGNRKLSMRDLIFLMQESDFPINSGHEAATLLTASCPVSAQAAV